MSKEDSDSEEEILVYAEFDDSVNIDKYRAIHILGADDKNPIIQLDETFFMGKYEHSLGTYMFFEQDHGMKGKDPLFDKYPEKVYKYVYKTKKLLSMEHAYVTPKEGNETNTPAQEIQTAAEDVQPVTFKDVEQATKAFKAYFNLEQTVPSTVSNEQHAGDMNQSTSQQNFIEITIDTSHKADGNVESMNIQNTDNSSESGNTRHNLDLLESISEQNPDDIRVESTEDITSNLGNTYDDQMEIEDDLNQDTILF